VLKKEAAEVTRKVEDTEVVMREIEGVTAEYLPLAQACSGIYFTLEQLANIDHFYQFSLAYFLEIFDYVLLNNPRLQGVSDLAARKKLLFDDLFLVTFQRASRSLLHTDHVVLAITLARLKLRGDVSEAVAEELDAVLEVPSGNGESVLRIEQRRSLESHLSQEVVKVLEEDLAANSAAWKAYVDQGSEMPWPWAEADGESFCAARGL
jgi:dynein heavy chain 1